MNLVVFHKEDIFSPDGGADLLSFLLTDPLLAHMVTSEYGGRNGDHQRPIPRIKRRTVNESLDSLKRVCWALPAKAGWDPKLSGCIFVRDEASLPLGLLENPCDDPWFVLSNGRYVHRLDIDTVESLLQGQDAQVIGLTFNGRLRGFRERVRLDRDRNVIGFQRYYDDSYAPMPLSDDWPHRVYIRRSLVQTWESLPWSYQAFLKACTEKKAVVKEYHIGGYPIDLKEGGHVLRWLCRMQNGNETQAWEKDVNGFYTRIDPQNGHASPQCRCYGQVWIGRDVDMHPSAILIGPVVIGDRVSIGERAVIDTAVIGPDTDIAARGYVSNTIITEGYRHIKADSTSVGDEEGTAEKVNRFKVWPVGSYVRCLKRILDIVFAVNVLLLFLPIMPVIALAIKINSPGPVFYGARRQGLHGKEFRCLKFRTMKVGADQLQDKLRTINEVDGPQFKMADDPRISTVGRFLRETYLDEIPQFINVVLGQMSIVGPRPSPKSENTHCPRWRDARLSVRPGVTGLWQLLRTREPSRDFQEWIHYDVEYVRRVSLSLDLWICWRTGLLMLSKFIHQF